MAEKYKVKLLKKEEVAESTMLFTLEKPEGFIYRAGQTIDLIINSLSGETMSHTFSLATAPHENELTIVTRMRDSDYKKTLRVLSEGSEVEVEGPYGSFALHQDDKKSAVFLVGGIGIAPFLSMIKDAEENKKLHKLYLFYSNRRPEDAPFLDELNTLADSKNIQLTFIPTMTNLENSTEVWTGEQGYITWEMIRKYIPESETAIYYMAGPQAMVTTMRSLLTANGVSEDDIRFEEFSGY